MTSTGRIPATLGNGSTIGGYRISGMLGRGGMGTVYLAEQLSIGRQVALKVMHPARMTAPGAAERFLSEARLAGRLQHPNLVTIHEAGIDPATGLAWFSMDYVHGRSLRMVVRQQGALEPSLALSIARQTAQGLAKAHAAGLVHRDIKPENLLIDHACRVSVTDLGLALDRAPPSAGQGARVLSVIGTPGWSAPEQLRNPTRAVAASDVFALGCCLYFMLTGEDPFTGETLIDLAVNVCTSDPPLMGSLPPRLAEVIDQLMAKDPAERPVDGAAAELLLAESTAPSAPAPRPRPRRRERLRR